MPAEPQEPPTHPGETAILQQLIASLRPAEGALDGLVHDAKSAEASAISNGGPGEQLAYLARALGVTGAAAALRELDR